MTPAERRTRLIRLLAEIDQGIADAKAPASDPLRWPEERHFAESQLAIRLHALKHVVALLKE